MSDTYQPLVVLDARCIKMDDLEETAEWCGGDPGIMYEGVGEGQHYIQLDYVRGVTGQWIVKVANNKFYILSDEEYKQTFYAATKNRELFTAVVNVVHAAMADGFANIQRGGGDQSMIAEAAALRIMELTQK